MQGEPTVQRWREYAVVSLAFASSRLVLSSLGLQFNFSLDWMWLSDPADLQNRLAQTIYYFQSSPTKVYPMMVVWVALGAIAIAVLASILPARRAAALNPVRALRHE